MVKKKRKKSYSGIVFIFGNIFEYQFSKLIGLILKVYNIDININIIIEVLYIVFIRDILLQNINNIIEF